MGSCQSTHYDLYVVSINGVIAAAHTSRAQLDQYNGLVHQRVHVQIRHLVVERATGMVLRVGEV